MFYMDKAERLQSAIEGLWELHSAHLADLKAGEWRKGTAWFDDRLKLVRSIREQIRVRESILETLV